MTGRVFLPMLQAALEKTQVIWDLCHWGVPDDVNPFAADFVNWFELYASAAAKVIQDHTDEAPFFCPITKISFWSLMGGQRGHFYPYGKRRGGELKRQLVEPSIAATHAIRRVAPNARFVQCEPIIQSRPIPKPGNRGSSQSLHARPVRGLGICFPGGLPPAQGNESCLDIIGCNYYWNNQWVHRSHATPIGHLQHRSLHKMLIGIV